MMLQNIAPAKVNLFLHLTDKLDNGYHLIESVMVFVNYGDEISIKDSDSFNFSTTGEYSSEIPSDGENIAVKTLDLLLEASGKKERPKLDIELKKNLPVGAGIGGGSADAALLMKLINEKCNLGYSIEELQDIGIKAGADIPVCLSCSSSFVSGTGEKVATLKNFPKRDIVLINPNKVLLTKDVFKIGTEKFSLPIKDKFYSLYEESNANILDFIKEQRNDLEKAAKSLIPEITEITDILNSQSGCIFARMSGSGATCFGIFENKEASNNALNNIRSLYPNWWVQKGTIF